MKTLEEFFNEIIEDIFRSFSEEHQKHLNKMFRDKTAEWLKQFIEAYQFDSMEETVYVTAFLGKLEKTLESEEIKKEK